MSDLLAARLQMAVSLGFHILFSVVGMAMPLLMAVAELRWLRTRDPIFKELALRWARGTAILFAVGAVSGTVLSFELGLLWPRFMEIAGPRVGLPFSLEGFAFFLEAIGIGLYLYGWDRMPPVLHWASGVVVAISGLMSGVFVVAVNSWMNDPTGAPFDLAGPIDPWTAFKSSPFPTQTSHMALAAYQSVAFAVLGIHAWRLLHEPRNRFHREAARIALVVAVAAAPLQILIGDLSAKHVAAEQPIKLAAAEALFHTEQGAGLSIGGWPRMEQRDMVGAIRIPYALSFLATGDPNATIKGLSDFPRELWPPVPWVHLAFQVMVACGFAMAALAAVAVVLWIRRRSLLDVPLLLRAAVVVAPLGLLAVEAGWTVTEVGRQPWIINGVLKTREAVTPMPMLWIPCLGFCLLYLFLGVVVLVLLRAHVFSVPAHTPSAPSAPATEGASP